MNAARYLPFFHADSLSDLDRQLRILIWYVAESAKADIRVMAARAKGRNPKFWRGLTLA